VHSQKSIYFLSNIPVKDKDGLFRIQVLKTGDWKYSEDEDGNEDTLIVTSALLQELKSNFESQVYYPVPIDGPVQRTPEETPGKAHSNSDRHDCGFIRALELSDDQQGLYAYIELTSPDITKMVDEGSLAFCSSELFFNWENPATRKPENVLSGLGLTNRPFIKGMEPAMRVLNLSEFSVATERGNQSMPNEIETLKAALAKAEKEAAKVVTLSEEANKAKQANISLAEKIKQYELREIQTKRAVELDKFGGVLSNAMEKRGALTPQAALQFAKLAETIINSGMRVVELAEEAEGDTGSIYRQGTGGIRKCDLIDMLTETINSLPGDVVHVQPTGKAYSDEDADLDEDGQMEMGDADGDKEKPTPFDGAHKSKSLSERFQPVQARDRKPKNAEFFLSEAKKLAQASKVGQDVALREVLKKHGIRNMSEVPN